MSTITRRLKQITNAGNATQEITRPVVNSWYRGFNPDKIAEKITMARTRPNHVDLAYNSTTRPPRAGLPMLSFTIR
jgi:hypothetical protein